MPKYGLLTTPTREVTSEIREIAKLGFDYAEICIEEPCGTPDVLQKSKNRILSTLKSEGIFAIAHTAYWVGFGTEHEKVRKGWIEEAKSMIRVASELHINLINFHFYPGKGMMSEDPMGRKLFVSNFIKSMKELAPYAKKYNMTLMLENLAAKDPKKTYGLRHFKRVIDSVPGLMVHFDAGHAFIEGGNGMVEKYIKIFNKKIVHIHVHDNHGETDEHLPLGEGDLNLKRLVAALKGINYNGTITFEVFTSNSDAKKSRKIFERIWEK